MGVGVGVVVVVVVSASVKCWCIVGNPFELSHCRILKFGHKFALGMLMLQNLKK